MMQLNNGSSAYIQKPVKILQTAMALLFIITLTPATVSASQETVATNNDNSLQTDTTKPADESVAQPIEAGAGGNIKLERPYRTRAESLSVWHAHILWESRYVTEGRDNLSGNGITSVSSEFAYKNLTIIPWLASNPNSDYTELNLNIIYGVALTDNIEAYAGYNRIHGREDKVTTNDDEISLDLAFKHIKNINLLASFYHSFDSNGSFMELAARRSHAINPKLNISIKGSLGINADYVTDGHNGLNHFQLISNIAYHPDTQMELYAYAGYSMAINRDANRYIGDELLDNFLWTGIGFTYRY